MKDFVKLKDLVDDEFTIEEAYGFEWKRWDNEARRMLTSETWQEGFSKIYDLVTDKGKLSVRQGQLQQMLEGAYQKGKSDIVGKTFHVKSNGKTGMDIRYYINLVRKPVREATEPPTSDISMDDIPFS